MVCGIFLGAGTTRYYSCEIKCRLFGEDEAVAAYGERLCCQGDCIGPRANVHDRIGLPLHQPPPEPSPVSNFCQSIQLISFLKSSNTKSKLDSGCSTLFKKKKLEASTFPTTLGATVDIRGWLVWIMSRLSVHDCLRHDRPSNLLRHPPIARPSQLQVLMENTNHRVDSSSSLRFYSLLIARRPLFAQTRRSRRRSAAEAQQCGAPEGPTMMVISDAPQESVCHLNSQVYGVGRVISVGGPRGPRAG